MPRERKMLATLVRRHVGTSRGVFELADGTQVELDGPLRFDSDETPEPGQKALVIVDEARHPVRWEPYPGAG
jgi:hypothetical protein